MKSFIEVSADSHFPIQNLPFGVFSIAEDEISSARVGVAIGDQILDLIVISKLFEKHVPELGNPALVFSQSSLNMFMSLGKPVWQATRKFLQVILSEDNPELRDNKELRNQAFIPQKLAKMHLPANIGHYTDFYASKEHATNCGIMLRGSSALFPNWIHLPVGYHGRASSVVVSGTDLLRPRGQRSPGKDQPPVFGPSIKLDFELEMAFFVGTGNNLGEPIPIQKAEDHIFGMDPTPFPYLQEEGKTAYDIHLEAKMKPSNNDTHKTLTRSNLKYMYWSIKQQLAHHTISGCNMRTGDLCGTGTISGPSEDARGSLLEITWNGKNEIDFGNGVKRLFVEDGDEVVLTGYCQGEGYKVGFGECSGKILPAISS
ncbi:34859_t:CDS:2 [Racocetra persica]|uniref:34859_t:CDS:1 n=1 Tax=Racocetra persica TaxID=160502 RepID=A0ACA9KRR4_9GLOM|nr:34859_t:CDS:2 [Racocetra persica]